jgi:transcriptional regulator with XRE-family HTH domain
LKTIESELLSKLGKNLKEYRTLKQLSQEKLAEICGLHRTYVGAIERSERNITIATLESLASALEIEAILLLG